MNWRKDSNKIPVLCLWLCCCFIACNTQQSTQETETKEETEELLPVLSEELSLEEEPENEAIIWKSSEGELSLVNVQDLDSTLLVDIKYAGTDNFTGKVLYTNLDKAYLQTEVANMLVEAHRYLKEKHPGLRFLIYDAARPLCIQEEMYEVVKNTPYHRYVAHPDKHSLHNYAAAVDLSIAGTDSIPLDMGTPFDFFGKAAGPSHEKELLEQGVLSTTQLSNRQLLREAMRHAGFRSIGGEWWHFNACSLSEAKQKYPLIECF